MENFNTREDWLRWRQTGIGSSDMPIIMGVSDYSTPLKLYEQKLAKDPIETGNNFVTDLGNQAEPKIRSLVELRLGKSFKPCNLQCAEFPFLLASLDGRSKDCKEGLEIKLINKEDWEIGKRDKFLPKQYKPQVFHQFNVGNLDKIYFAMYLYSAFKTNQRRLSLENLVILEVKPDIKYQTDILQKAIEFWDLVLKKKPPISARGDLIPLNGLGPEAKAWKALHTKLIASKQKVKELEKEMEESEAKIIAAAVATGHSGLRCNGLEVSLSSRIGAIDYGNIPELESVDLEQYRKPCTMSWSVKPEKKEPKNGKENSGKTA